MPLIVKILLFYFSYSLSHCPIIDGMVAISNAKVALETESAMVVASDGVRDSGLSVTESALELTSASVFGRVAQTSPKFFSCH